MILSMEGGSKTPRKRPLSTLARDKMMIETKISLAINQLNEQIKKSMKSWGKFRDEYLTEVNGVRQYIADLPRMIWRKEANLDGVHGHGGEKKRFAIQSTNRWKKIHSSF